MCNKMYINNEREESQAKQITGDNKISNSNKFTLYCNMSAAHCDDCDVLHLALCRFGLEHVEFVSISLSFFSLLSLSCVFLFLRAVIHAQTHTLTQMHSCSS